LLGVSAVEFLLEELNNDENLHPHLKEHPLMADALRFRIEFRDKNHLRYFDGAIDSVTIDRGEVTYTVTPPDEEYVWPSEVLAEESYVEAKQRAIPPTKSRFSYPIPESLKLCLRNKSLTR